MSGVKVDGLGEVLAAIKNTTDRLKEGYAAGINNEAFELEAASVPEVPVKTGRLRESHYVEQATADNLHATVGYNADYAIAVHENTLAHHEVGKAKYLEDPMNARRPGYAERVAEFARKYLAK